MLRTSLRSVVGGEFALDERFLSSNAQDFIEEESVDETRTAGPEFLSSNAQDFIEDRTIPQLL